VNFAVRFIIGTLWPFILGLSWAGWVFIFQTTSDLQTMDRCWIIVTSKMKSSGNTWNLFGRQVDLRGSPWTVWDVTDASSVGMRVFKSRHPTNCQRVGSQIQTSGGLSAPGFSDSEIPLTVSTWDFKAGNSMQNPSLVSPGDVTGAAWEPGVP
jgi:hypothetical protein